jgi:hypothetical protein
VAVSYGFTGLLFLGSDIGSHLRTWGRRALSRKHRGGDDGSRWVAEANGWVAIAPAHDHGEFLRSVTEGGRQALGLRLDINSNAYFDYAREGHVIVSFDPTWPQERSGNDPHVLDHLMDGLRFQVSDDDVLDDFVEAPESVSSALALIGRFTETDIATDWFLAQHSRIRPTS